MHDIVKIGLNQKVPSADLNRIGELARAGLSAETRQMLVPTLAWADFTCTFANGSFLLNVSQGYLYKDGLQYRTLGATPIDMVADVPPSEGLKRIVSIVAYAIPAKDDAPEQREFAVVVTPATNSAPAVYQSESRQANTLNRQIAQVSRRTGDLAPQPTPPPLTPDLCEIAQVVLGRAGIERVDMNEGNRAPNLSRERRRVDDLTGFVEGQGARLDTLDKNLAALAARIPQPVADSLIRQITRNLSNLNEATKLKAGDLAYQIEYGLDLSKSDNTYVGYSATVEDGIRFPWIASKEAPLALFTPGDRAVKVISGLMLADFVEQPRITVTGMDGSLSIASQVNAVITARRVEIPRTLVRTGKPFPVCENSRFWRDGRYDAANQLFTRFGETFNIIDQRTHANGHIIYRLEKSWVDRWIETRWEQVATPIGLNGAMRGQTFRVPDFGYLTSIELPFTTKDAAQGITLLLCETVGGAPDLTRVLERSDLAAADVVADATGKKRTKFPFRPALVDPGKLYSWVTITRGAYALATVNNNKFAEGTSFLTTDGGAFFQGDPLVDFPFTANFARFRSPRVEIRLNDVDNVNGDTISALKFLYGSLLPAGTRIVHMARRSGGDWQTLGEVVADGTPSDIGAGPFDTGPLPVSVQQKVVLVGTTTLMPAIDLSQAWVTALKLGNLRDHISLPINFGTPCNRAEVQVAVDGPFDPVNHVTGCRLIVAGAAVTPAATSFVDDVTKPGRRLYTYAFSFANANSVRVGLAGTLTSILAPYFVEERFIRAWLV